MAVYEKNDEVLRVLQRRGWTVEREIVVQIMEQLDLRFPLGEADVQEIVANLKRAGTPPDRHLARVARELQSDEWRQQVHKVRLRLGLPPEGYSLERARELYRTYMGIWSNSPGRTVLEETDVQVATFWLKAVQEARLLCPLLQIDPGPLDRVLEAHGHGRLDPLLGIGKLLAPDMIIEKDGHEIPFDPDPTDRLVGHLVWDLALNAQEMSARPSVSLSYELLENGHVVTQTRFFGFEHAMPGEMRELKRQYKELMTAEKRMGMYHMMRRRRTWKDRLEWWNGRYPDWAYRSTEALRKAVYYEMKKSERERGRDPRPMVLLLRADSSKPPSSHK